MKSANCVVITYTVFYLHCTVLVRSNHLSDELTSDKLNTSNHLSYNILHNFYNVLANETELIIIIFVNSTCTCDAYIHLLYHHNNYYGNYYHVT